MNVLVIGHAQIRDSNRDVYRELAALGVGVTLLVPPRWRTAFGKIEAEPAAGDDVRLIVAPIAGRHHSNLYWYRDGVAPAIAASDANAIYVDEDPAGFAAFQAARVARRRRLGLVVLAVQNIFKRYPQPFAAIQRSVLGTASAAVTNSAGASETLRRRGYSGPFFEKPLTTGALPLPPAERRRVRASHGMHRTTFGYVGRLVKEKGIDVFLDALAQVPDADGIIAGAGPERGGLMARAGRLGISDRVRFIGALASADAAGVIGAIDTLVLPSLTMPNWSEQFGRVLVEAMAAGTPIVASASGAIPEVVGNAGILVREGDATALAGAMARLRDTSLRTELVARGYARVHARFSSRAVAGELKRALRYATCEGSR